jgi:hypothetical protein
LAYLAFDSQEIPMRRLFSSTVVLAILMLLSASAYANSGIILTFAGLGDMQAVGGFYNGSGLASTPNYGISFSSNFFGLRSVANGGPGNFASTPTNTPAIFVNGPTGAPAVGTMNAWGGFSSGLNFYFTAGFTGGQTETVTIWSGVNGTGTVLATITLANNSGSCGSPAYCTWSNIGATFSGTAHSVTFSGPANELGISDITLGSSSTVIPEPSSIFLLGTGLAGLSLGGLRRYLTA